MYTPPDGAEDAVPGEVIRSATWNTIFTDLSSALTQVGQSQVPGTRNLQASLAQSRAVNLVRGISFSTASLDHPLNITLPTGYSYFGFNNIKILSASATISTATCGIFTAPNAAGVTIVASGTTVSVVPPVTSGLVNTVQNLTILNSNTSQYNDGTIYFRVQTPQGASLFANVAAEITFLS